MFCFILAFLFVDEIKTRPFFQRILRRIKDYLLSIVLAYMAFHNSVLSERLVFRAIFTVIFDGKRGVV